MTTQYRLAKEIAVDYEGKTAEEIDITNPAIAKQMLEDINALLWAETHVVHVMTRYAAALYMAEAAIEAPTEEVRQAARTQFKRVKDFLTEHGGYNELLSSALADATVAAAKDAREGNLKAKEVLAKFEEEIVKDLTERAEAGDPEAVKNLDTYHKLKEVGVW